MDGRGIIGIRACHVRLIGSFSTLYHILPPGLKLRMNCILLLHNRLLINKTILATITVISSEIVLILFNSVYKLLLCVCTVYSAIALKYCENVLHTYPLDQL